MTGDSAPGRDEVRAAAAPGTGWPGDPADASTPVAFAAEAVRELADGAESLHELTARQSVCRACPRLVQWREDVAITRRRSFLDERYWGRPIPGWGDQEPSILIVGLAPAAHGGNRTGRVFTGDRSGDFIFGSLYRCGLAALPTSVSAGDGQRLIGARVAAVVRCAPPANKPTPQERDTCAPWLIAELRMIAPSLRTIVCLGGFAWQALWPVLSSAGYQVPRPRPAFAHGAEVNLRAADGSPLLLLGCYHPSQQNTFTGRLTSDMLDEIFDKARAARSLFETRTRVAAWHDAFSLWAEIRQTADVGRVAEALAALLRSLCRADAERTADRQPGDATAAGHVDQGSLGMVEPVVSRFNVVQGVEHILS